MARHILACQIEHMLADQLGVDWAAYDREVSGK
jgi:hypothetical protein